MKEWIALILLLISVLLVSCGNSAEEEAEQKWQKILNSEERLECNKTGNFYSHVEQKCKTDIAKASYTCDNASVIEIIDKHEKEDLVQQLKEESVYRKKIKEQRQNLLDSFEDGYEVVECGQYKKQLPVIEGIDAEYDIGAVTVGKKSVKDGDLSYSFKTLEFPMTMHIKESKENK